MKWKFEEEFRLDKPETIGETDRHFDLDNYKDWLEFQLAESRKQLSLFAVSGRSEQSSLIHHCGNELTEKEIFHDHCLKCSEYISED